MGAIIVISYLVICLVFGALMTTVVSMFRNVSSSDNFMSWKWILGFAIFAAVGPYAFMEGLTRKYDHVFDQPVTQMLQTIKLKGQLAYYRVTNGDDKRARILAVANEMTSIRFNDRVVIEINFVKDAKNKWVVQDYEVLSSFERQKDVVVLPPMF